MEMEMLPKDVLMEILSSLPVRSLLRFKSVCKYWYALLTQNPNFIALHHSRAKNNDCVFFRRLDDGSDKEKESFVLSSISETPDLDVELSCLDGLIYFKDRHILGSCNGLLSLVGQTRPIIVICNPAMREFRVLPRPSPYDETSSWRTTLLGFGFDAITNDYKVFRLTTLYQEIEYLDEYDDPQTTLKVVDEKAQLYSLSTDSWREVVVDSADVPKRYMWGCTSLNGVLYWLGSGVVAFRLSDESFERIPFPDACLKLQFNLFTLHDSLALVPSMVGSCFDVWVMDGYACGKKECYWTKKYAIKLNFLEAVYYTPLGFRQNGEFLLVRCVDRMMVSYDFIAEKIKEYKVYDVSPTAGWHLEFIGYAECLVSVKRRVVDHEGMFSAI